MTGEEVSAGVLFVAAAWAVVRALWERRQLGVVEPEPVEELPPPELHWCAGCDRVEGSMRWTSDGRWRCVVCRGLEVRDSVAATLAGAA